MKLSLDKIGEIKSCMEKWDLETILEWGYPNAEIFVIRGFDKSRNEYYVRDTFFDEERAYTEINKVLSKDSPYFSDTFQIYSETPESLENSVIFDDIDKRVIYNDLEKNYKLGD